MAALRLSPSPPVGVVGRIAIGLLLAGLGVGGVLVSYDWTFGTIPLLLADPPGSATAVPGWLWGWLWVVLWGLGGLTLPGWFTLHAVRVKSTLDGTVLTVRGPLRTRSADLAVARVRGETEDTMLDDGTANLYLVARMPGSDREVRLDLGRSDRILPRPQLAALADAIAAGGLEDDGRRAVVERLRRYVGQRFGVPRYLWEDPQPLGR